MPHALLLTLLFATSVAADPSTPADKTQPRDEDAQDRTLKMAVVLGAQLRDLVIAHLREPSRGAPGQVGVERGVGVLRLGRRHVPFA